MNHPDKPGGEERGPSEEFLESPPPGADPRAQPPRQRPAGGTPDKEGGAPADELDLDGDGSRRQ